ncbi:LEAF RUST 10 DISEASE-RESISTANCE LOCUS RECEPTOR-LIKE PROTEIN KINASE-like 1.5 [Vicia villosa]|uniref:LEAF RUST 10 DISEASE-RESISTANCE LOCUS RECEPTOR-LIKE PROTEIN KINASE-like 1.5 n=1 Tax=Vicia villosa TaxID=3911 RepID=UPI00273B69CE|nr:LEAF RUST 10 DISEASE-RESISTANCE LOCUS RECEPTOR-LIKE PROTEIN KINASE-like 1.5 [Vicia villosa]
MFPPCTCPSFFALFHFSLFLSPTSKTSLVTSSCSSSRSHTHTIPLTFLQIPSNSKPKTLLINDSTKYKPHFQSSSITMFPLTILLVLFFVHFPTSTLTCSSNINPNSTKTHPCPPFSSTPPFPFSTSPGCGHPSFQLNCSSPHSFISINNLSFSLLSYKSNTSSITLSPHNPQNNNTCPSPSSSSIPNKPINLSNSPFTLSDELCSRLSFLQPCPPPTLPNCTHCPWQCKIIKNPTEIFTDCRSMHHSVSDSEPSCQSDVLSYLNEILTLGIELQWDEALTQDSYFTNCTECINKKGFCGYNSSDPSKHFICFHSIETLSPPWIHKMKLNKIAVFAVIIAFTSLLLFITVTISILRSRSLNSRAKLEEDPTTVFLHNHHSANLFPPVFTYDELNTSTNNFDPNRKLGDGGFGSVYLGKLRDGKLAAVKHLHRQNQNHTSAFSSKSFCNEIIILSSINHPNLVKLHGYCNDPRGLILVYDYVPNGTLAEHIHGSRSKRNGYKLTWQTRLDIAIQTALAMEYLHFAVKPPIVHRDITSSNIFVEKDMRIKVGDFGLSRLLILQETSQTTSSGGYVWTGPQGTPGYLDPDYHRSFRLTEKSDVYSFGVVLLELISGLKAVDYCRDKREMALADMVVSRIHTGQLREVLDPVLDLGNDGEALDAVAAVAELAFRCVASDKDDRPDSREVVGELKRVRLRRLVNDDVAKE